MALLKIGEIKDKPTTLQDPNTDTEPFYTFSGSLDTTKYEDITSNKNWMSVGLTNYDYIKCKEQVKEWTAYLGFSALTTEEQKVASKHFTVSKEDRDKVHTEEEQSNNWELFVDNVRDARQKRWSAAKSYISFHLSHLDSVDIAKSTKELSTDYIEYGIESYNDDGVSALFDWIEGNTDYSGDTAGFQAKSYYSQTHEDRMMDILRNGNYS